MSVMVRVRNGCEPELEYGNGGVTEGDLRGDMADIINDGAVVDLAGGHCLVHEADTPAMTVVVDPGIVYIPNASFDETDSDTIKFWEAVVAGITASRTVTIGANSSGQTRYDLICAYLNPATAPDEYASNVAVLNCVAGTPGAGIPATPSNHRRLAVVKVDNGETEILDADITDSRTQVELKNAVIPATLTGKQIADPTTPTKKLAFDLSGATANKTITFVSSHSDDRTITLPNATDTLVGKATTDTLTNKRITRRVNTVADGTLNSGTYYVTPNSDTTDELTVTALAHDTTIAAPTGTPTEGQTLILRIKDDGTARALTWNTAYRASTDLPLPTTTVLGKTLYCGFIRNESDSKWDLLAILGNF